MLGLFGVNSTGVYRSPMTLKNMVSYKLLEYNALTLSVCKTCATACNSIAVVRVYLPFHANLNSTTLEYFLCVLKYGKLWRSGKCFTGTSIKTIRAKTNNCK